MRRAEDLGAPRARASQILEMLLQYGLIEDAWRQGDDDDFVVDHHGRRRLRAEEVLAEYGDRVAAMVERVVEHSTLTTTHTSVPVGRAEGPVPYIIDVGDRVAEYQRYW